MDKPHTRRSRGLLRAAGRVAAACALFLISDRPKIFLECNQALLETAQQPFGNGSIFAKRPLPGDQVALTRNDPAAFLDVALGACEAIFCHGRNTHTCARDEKRTGGRPRGVLDDLD